MVIRIPTELFARLQTLATPLVDTPASVIAKLLDDAGVPPAPTPAPLPAPVVEDDPIINAFETYANTVNRHVTIHRRGCAQLRKHGGVHQHGQGTYMAHTSLDAAETYAASTNLPPKPAPNGHCGFCKPA
jgi:hypothetical protein